MANSGYIEKAKAGASKAILDAMPRILRESAAIGKNKYKYIKPDGEELPIEIDDTDAKSLAYAATKMAERLIELSNKTDGFFLVLPSTMSLARATRTPGASCDR